MMPRREFTLPGLLTLLRALFLAALFGLSKPPANDGGEELQ